ncbi:MAG: FMN-binding protein [Planctomycetes bacterium]|nr:FMN-binding protein [Planctomycetota bacterium]
MLKSRPFRLLIAGVILALLFPQARGITLALIFIGILCYAPMRRSAKLAAASIAVVIAGGALACAKWNVRSAMTDIIRRAPDGVHTGEAEGKHGPIAVRVAVKSGRIEQLAIAHQDENVRLKSVVVALVEVPNRIHAQNTLAVDGITGATETSKGIREAAYNALAGTMDNPPRVTWLSKAALWLGQVNIERETFFQLAIILTVILFVDFVVQAVVVTDTGQALNCMNCQACVGVCPVRRVEDGVPLPMQLVMQTRLGNYRRVEELAQYCVGCGQCAAKCPSGISALNIAGSAIAAERLRGGHIPLQQPQEVVP